jgi:hypothetical protein
MKMKSFRIDPGTPCHALNCPGFSAFKQKRSYRATLPSDTTKSSQYFGSQLKFPSEIDVAETSSLPTNILGVFDHEKNQNVPDRLVDWKLANWPVGNNIETGLVTDPDFITNWTTAGLNTYPSDFTPVDTLESGLDRVQKSSLEFTSTAFMSIDPSSLSPYLWFTPDDLTDADGASMSSGVPNKGSSGGNIDDDAGHPMPIVRHNALGPFKAIEADGTSTMVAQFDNRLDIDSTVNYTAIAVYGARAGTTAAGGDVGLLIGGDPDNPTEEGLQFPRQEASSVARAFYNSADDISDAFDNTATLLSGAYHISVLRRESKSGPLTGRHWAFHDGVDITPSTPVVQANSDSVIETIFSLGNSESTEGSQLVELFVYDSLLTDAQVEGSWQFLADKYFSGSENTDILKITVASGISQGIQRTIPLEKNQVATCSYLIRGETGVSGISEVYTAISGNIEVSTEINQVWETVVSGSSLTNYYQLSGTLPGETGGTSKDNSWWEVKREIRSLEPRTYASIAINVNGDNPSQDQNVFIDRFNIEKQSSYSSKFEYSTDSILGLNWEGKASHIRDENLFQFSEAMPLWETSGNTESIYKNTGVRLTSQSGSIYQSVPGLDLLDDTFTLTWESESPIPTSGIVKISQFQSQVFPWTTSSQRKDNAIVFSGIQHQTNQPMEVRWSLFGGEASIYSPQIVHGSGRVDYIQTESERVKKYRRIIKPSNLNINKDWAPGYALVEGGSVYTSQEGFIDLDGAEWRSTDTRGFPEEGVLRIEGQEYGYREKNSIKFLDTIPGWRGTKFNPAIITSGSTITNVPIPQSITHIDPVNKEITFKDIIPAPLGDWKNGLNLQIYNTHISNIDRFSLQSSAVPITQATGNLLTSFLQHISDHRRHFKFSQLCNNLIDPSSWAASPFIKASLVVVKSPVEEITESAQINVEAVRFLESSSKKITIKWGDGTTTTLTGSKNLFSSIPHIYDLKQNASPKFYTITVVVEDLDLGFSRQANTSIVIRPKLNSIGQPTKSSIISRAKIIKETAVSTIAGAKIISSKDITTSAGAKISVA